MKNISRKSIIVVVSLFVLAAFASTFDTSSYVYYLLNNGDKNIDTYSAQVTNEYTDWNSDTLLIMQHGEYTPVCVTKLQRTPINVFNTEVEGRSDMPEETVEIGSIVQVKYSDVCDSMYVRFNNFLAPDTGGWTTLIITD